MSKFLNHPIRVAVLGSGGREHALAWKIAQSPFCESVVVVPGNGGIGSTANKKISCQQIAQDQWIDFFKSSGMDLIVVGPDDLLAEGIVDELRKDRLAVFGPSKQAAKLEWSKSFAKEVMLAAGVPTAQSKVISKKEEFSLSDFGLPVVLKYDGLALGKGVRVCTSEKEVSDFLKEIFDDKVFTRKNIVQPKVLIEEFLTGHEVSLFALVDGEHVEVFEPACDYKRLKDGNLGPNTGGMGAYSPVPWLPKEEWQRIGSQIFLPILKEMKKRKSAFSGLLYAGLIISKDQFWVLEFNARFGDPETQALLARIDSDLLPLLYGVATSTLQDQLFAYPLRWKPQSAVTVVAASRGYPEKPETGYAIQIQDGAECPLFFAGVKSIDSKLVTSGGRVLSLTALGNSLDDARLAAYLGLEKIHFDGICYRRDVGKLI